MSTSVGRLLLRDARAIVACARDGDDCAALAMVVDCIERSLIHVHLDYIMEPL